MNILGYVLLFTGIDTGSKKNYEMRELNVVQLSRLFTLCPLKFSNLLHYINLSYYIMEWSPFEYVFCIKPLSNWRTFFKHCWTQDFVYLGKRKRKV